MERDQILLIIKLTLMLILMLRAYSSGGAVLCRKYTTRIIRLPWDERTSLFVLALDVKLDREKCSYTHTNAHYALTYTMEY